MLTTLDEYPLHQLATTFAAVQSADQSWNDGHYICLCDMAGRIALIGTIRLYQNNDVLEGFVLIRHGGRQHNIRLSRRLRPNLDSFAVGPLRLEIVEPMRAVRLVLDDNDFGMACDITCRSTSVPYEDPVAVRRVDGRLVMERAVYEIVGTCEGQIRVEGAEYTVTPDDWFFFRNHSWGVMEQRGGPRPYAAPPRKPARPRPGLRQWVLYRMSDHGGFYQLFEDAAGKRVSSDGAILLADRTVAVSEIEHELQFHPGGMRLQSGRFSLVDVEGGRRSFEVEDLGWIYCQGGGYFGGFNDGLGNGVYRGDYHVEGETWDVWHPTRVVASDGSVREFDHAWAESFTRIRSGDEVGLAHFECVVFRP